MYNVQQEPEEDSDCEYGLFVGFLSFGINNIDNIDQEWMENIMVCDSKIDFQLDMGVMCKVFSYDTLQKLKKVDLIRKAKIPLKSYSGHTIKPKRIVTLECKHKDRQYNI